jgi:hypothetical protein
LVVVSTYNKLNTAPAFGSGHGATLALAVGTLTAMAREIEWATHFSLAVPEAVF